jgi:hypothetical protein
MAGRRMAYVDCDGQRKLPTVKIDSNRCELVLWKLGTLMLFSNGR